MTKRIEEDHKQFIDVISGKFRKELKKYIDSGQIFPNRNKGISIPRINNPHIVYGESDGSVGRGKGKPGDVIGKKPDNQPGKAGDEHVDGIIINYDLDELFDVLQEELKLPDLRPKDMPTYEEIKIKYNSLSMTGPESLRHNRKTMLQALKRMVSTGEWNNFHYIPGFSDPVRLITPINADKRYRQYNEIRIPSSNAVIFFARDASASMDSTKCDIASDIAWWLDAWIRRYYDKVQKCYVVHDTEAEEVDEKKFYNYRFAGGTRCSSVVQFIAKQLEDRFPPNKWNIYVFYFTDGENEEQDNDKLLEVISNQLGPNSVNLFGMTQILFNNYGQSVKAFLDSNLKSKNYKSVEVNSDTSPYGFYSSQISDSHKNEQIKKVIIELIGATANV